MHRLLASVRSGAWLTAERIQVYSAIVLVLGAIMVGALVATGDGIVDYQRRPIGTDFSNVYAAGQWVLQGRPEAPFSPKLQHEMERRIFGDDTPFYGWHYPPVFLAVAALLALLPYLVSLSLWQAATLVPYLATIGGVVRGVGGKAGASAFWLLPALAFPAVLINVAHGHNGFLTAALFGGALLLLDRRPTAAGVLFGLLCYKPQFGLLIPLVLAATGRWRVFAAATATVAAAVVLTVAAFGTQTWLAFRDSLEFTRTAVLEEGGTGFHKIQSPFAAVRLWGGPLALAYAAQAASLIAVAAAVVRVWRTEAAFALKASALLSGALLSTPYLLDYDLVVMAPAIAFLAAHGIEHGFRPYEKTALAFVWIAPLLSRALAEYALIPLGMIALILLFGLAVGRAVSEAKTSGRFLPASG